MSNLISVADAIRREAKRHEAFVEAAKVLERIGSLEQAEEDAKRRHATATRDATAAQEKLRVAEEELVQAEAGIRERLALATVDVSTTLAQAAAQAMGILDTAKAEAGRIAAEAKKSFDVQDAELRRVFKDFQAGKEAAAKEFASVQSGIAEKRAELAQVESKIAAARDAVAKMLR